MNEEKKVEDMFAPVEPVENSPEAETQPAPVTPQIPNVPQASVPASLPSTSTPAAVPPKPAHGWVKFVVIALIILIVIVVGLLLNKFIFSSGSEGEAVQVDEPVEIETVVEEKEIVQVDKEDDEEIVFDSDTDNDGLSDQEELEYGTNIIKMDTDSDGLFDYDEVMIYLTDPLDSDSDGDSFLDGEEVQAGYNPKGPGKLLNFQAEFEKLEISE